MQPFSLPAGMIQVKGPFVGPLLVSLMELHELRIGFGMKWRGLFGGGAASGAAGALVASRARGTQYVRARTVPVNPRTSFQQIVRNAVKTLTTLWQNVSEEQRGQWANYAANVTVTNVLGDATTLSGVNWFVGNNVPRLQAGLAATLDGPIIFDRGNPNWSEVLPSVDIVSNGTLGTLDLNADITGCNGTNGAMLVYVTRPFGPAIRSFGGPTQLSGVFPTNGAGTLPAGSYTFQSAFVASGVADTDSANQMAFTLRLDRGDGRLSSKFREFVVGS